MVDHTKPSITLDVYGELWNEDADKRAEKMDVVLRATPAALDAVVSRLG
jgi:hypothetical protein